MLLLPALSISGKVKLPSLLSYNAVLQQQAQVKLWGECEPGKEIRITPSWSNETISVKAAKDGNWSATVNTPQGGFTPYEITFDDGDQTIIRNVLIGEVWLYTDSSTMQGPCGEPGQGISGGGKAQELRNDAKTIQLRYGTFTKI